MRASYSESQIMKDFFIADAPRFENQAITSYFSLASIGVRERKGGGQYLALTLADKTGQFEARMWEEFADALQTCSDGCFVKVQGLISKYQGKFQITVTRMRSAAEREIERSDFIPTTQFDIEAMNEELRGYVAQFENRHLKSLVLAFLDDAEIGPAFREAPAAKRLHHAWLGGLLEHVLALVRVCLAAAPFYPEVDTDLLVTGAILHDIGKVRELSWASSFQYTLEGQLVGHITIGLAMVHERVAALNLATRERASADGTTPDLFPRSLLLLLEHLILSHHGKLEFGSPKLPMTPEAILFSALDDLEAKFQTLRMELASARSAGKPVSETTEWVRSMERQLFDSRAYLEAERITPAEREGAKSKDEVAIENDIVDDTHAPSA